jgi:hypothetical protein
MTNRIDTYTAWKRVTVDAMMVNIEQVTKALAREIITELNSEVNMRAGEDIGTVVKAMHLISPAGALPQVSLGPHEPDPEFTEAIKEILESYRLNTGLELIGAELTLFHVYEDEVWSCQATFSCPPWQKLFQERVSCPAEITVTVEFNDCDHRRSNVPNAPYLEVIDLLALKATADEYWDSPAVWAKTRQG